MDRQNAIIEIHELLVENKLTKALEVLDQIDNDKSKLEIINLKARVNSLIQTENTGTLQISDIITERNKINVAIFSITEKLSLSNKEIKNESINRDELKFFRDLLEILETSKAIFHTQLKLRFKLDEILHDRFGKLDFDTVANLFSEYYNKMNKEELRLHKVIRGYTKNISEQNFAAFDLIKNNLKYISKVQGLKYLKQHLLIWKSKYNSLIDDESICLIHANAEEGMRFPVGIENEINKHINILLNRSNK